MLRIVFRNRHRNLPKAEGDCSGPQGRINKMRKLVTALVRHERIEGITHYLDESRGYAERLIQEAQKHGDKHKPTMELADYWLLEKDLIHKLFKVLCPRYAVHDSCVTQLHRLPTAYPGSGVSMAILELKGNPWPPVVTHVRDHSGSLVNVLLSAARKDYQWKHRVDDEASHDSALSQQLDSVLSLDEAQQATLSLDDCLVGDDAKEFLGDKSTAKESGSSVDGSADSASPGLINDAHRAGNEMSNKKS